MLQLPQHWGYWQRWRRRRNVCVMRRSPAGKGVCVLRWSPGRKGVCVVRRPSALHTGHAHDRRSPRVSLRRFQIHGGSRHGPPDLCCDTRMCRRRRCVNRRWEQQGKLAALLIICLLLRLLW
jgi:hypothetical protein